MQLVTPDPERLAAYAEALDRGWSPDELRPEAAAEQRAGIARDPAAFVRGLDDRDAAGGPITLPDGSQAPRLPGFRRWIWQDGFCGTIGLRWQPGTAALPEHCLGHAGYAVVPWRRGEGLATAALLAILPQARAVGLPVVEITAKTTNAASIRVIEKAGGVFVEAFRAPASLGGGDHVKFRIPLAAGAPGA